MVQGLWIIIAVHLLSFFIWLAGIDFWFWKCVSHRAKVQGILKKLNSYKFLCKVAAYLDILESMGPLSLVFEKNMLLAHKVIPAVDLSMTNLEELHKLSMMQ